MWDGFSPRGGRVVVVVCNEEDWLLLGRGTRYFEKKFRLAKARNEILA